MTDSHARFVPRRLRRACAVLLLAGLCGAAAAATPVRMARIAFMGEPPVYLAEAQGYFEQAGLAVTFKQNPAGRTSLKDLFEGRVDVITIADTPLVYQAFKRDDFVILSGITHSETIAGAVARRDRIAAPRALAGKKVGLARNTASEYLLDQYLVAHNLRARDLTIVDGKPKQLVDGLAAGDLDAIFTWQPFVLKAQRRLGDNAYLLPTRGMKVLDWLLVGSREFVEKNPRTVELLLRALDRSIAYIREHPVAARSAFARLSGIDRELVDALWDELSFDLFLSESMLINMEDQARWALMHRNLGRDTIPNYLPLIHFEALERVRPEAITLIR